MNQQTLQKIYKTYQTKEYYNRYFTQLKLREDSREFSQARDIKITIRNNTVAVSKGQTIVICQLATQVQKLIFNSLDKSYGKPLFDLNAKFSNAKGVSHRQIRPTSSVEEFVNNKIAWRQIEDQLTVKQTGNKYFGHTGKIEIRVVSNDGSMNEACLFAVQLLLWSSKFNRIDSESGQIKNQLFMLEIPYFHYPSKYCEIMDQLLVDPTLSEEENSSYTISLIGDLLSNKIYQNFLLVQRIGKNCDKIPKPVLDSIISMWRVEMSKLTFDIKDLRRRVNDPSNTNQSIDLLICQ